MSEMSFESLMRERHKLDDCYTLISKQLYKLEKLAAYTRSLFEFGDVVRDGDGDLWVISDFSIFENDIVHGEMKYFGKPFNKKSIHATINLCGGKEATFLCEEVRINAPFYLVSRAKESFKKKEMKPIVEEWQEWEKERESCWDEQQRIDQMIAGKLAKYEDGVYKLNLGDAAYQLTRKKDRIQLFCLSENRPSLCARF